MAEKPSLKAVFDALTEDSPEDPDWCHDVLERADPRDVEKVRQAFREGGTEGEVAIRLDIWPR